MELYCEQLIGNNNDITFQIGKITSNKIVLFMNISSMLNMYDILIMNIKLTYFFWLGETFYRHIMKDETPHHPYFTTHILRSLFTILDKVVVSSSRHFPNWMRVRNENEYSRIKAYTSCSASNLEHGFKLCRWNLYNE